MLQILRIIVGIMSAIAIGISLGSLVISTIFKKQGKIITMLKECVVLTIFGCLTSLVPLFTGCFGSETVEEIVNFALIFSIAMVYIGPNIRKLVEYDDEDIRAQAFKDMKIGFSLTASYFICSVLVAFMVGLGMS